MLTELDQFNLAAAAAYAGLLTRFACEQAPILNRMQRELLLTIPQKEIIARLSSQARWGIRT